MRGAHGDQFHDHSTLSRVPARSPSTYPNPRSRTLPSILERDAEITALTGLLDTAAVTGGRVLLIRGEVGIGKSTVINHFVTKTADRSTAVVGFCDDSSTHRSRGR